MLLMVCLNQSILQLKRIAINHTINILKYNPLAGSSYIKLWKELDYSRKGLFNIQNTSDTECVFGHILTYLHPAGHHPAMFLRHMFLV